MSRGKGQGISAFLNFKHWGNYLYIFISDLISWQSDRQREKRDKLEHPEILRGGKEREWTPEDRNRPPLLPGTFLPLSSVTACLRVRKAQGTGWRLLTIVPQCLARARNHKRESWKDEWTKGPVQTEWGMRVPWPGSSSRICSERATIVRSHAGSLGLTDPAGRLQEPLCRDGFTNLSYLLFGRTVRWGHSAWSSPSLPWALIAVFPGIIWPFVTWWTPTLLPKEPPSKSHVSRYPLYPHPALTFLLTSCSPPFYFYVCMCTYVC